MSGSSSEQFKQVPQPLTSNGKRLWRSIDELNQSPEFLEQVKLEFPDAVDNWVVEDPQASPETIAKAELSRRTFLGVMGAGMALLGMTGCSTRQPDQKIVPYVNQPEFLVPGRPLFFASTLCLDGYGSGVLIEQHEGRPTKIEGNPDHPASLGASNVFLQAAILEMYDPKRAQAVLDRGASTTWSKFGDYVSRLLADKSESGGKGLRILAEPSTSPTLAAQVAAFKKKYPQAKWHTYSPAHRDNTMAGAKLAFGSAVNAVYHFEKADVVLSVDSDFLIDDPGSLVYARRFVDRRRVRKGRTEMNRLYVLESTSSSTGAMADHRLPLSPDNISATLRAIAAALGIAGVDAGGTAVSADKIKVIVDDLTRAGKGAVVVVGESQPPAIHALGHAINAKLGSAGTAVTYIDCPEIDPVDNVESIESLVADMNAGQVDTLLILGGNPIYNAPADLNFKNAINRVETRIRLSKFEDETSFECHWQLPMSHEIESWGDARSFDGTASLVQPLIAPLYATKNEIELMSILLGEQGRTNHDIVRDTWLGQGNNKSDQAKFEGNWEKWLRDGVIADSAPAPKRVAIAAGATAAKPATQPTTQSTSGGGMTVVFRTDPTIGDGRWANSSWLQETPKPVTKITWDNAALMSFATAKKLGVERGSVVDLVVGDRSIGRAGVLTVPGLPDDVITAHLGYGRTMAGEVGTGVGFNAYSIRTSDAMWVNNNLRVDKLSGSYLLAIPQETQVMHGRELFRFKDIKDYGREPGEQQEHKTEESVQNTGESVGEEHGREYASTAAEASTGKKKTHPLNLYQNWDYSKGNQWGMVIDNNACIGCNACVVSCQSENNVPTVGKEMVSKGRIMHWLRIDTYFASQEQEIDDQPLENPDVFFEPVACMHCEEAHCETVCPVGATVHDSEGTNNMVYNRCVGTRYCSNNCPYKVRRFNYLSYNWEIAESLRMMKNPDVTIRNRGVMEKCSYCIQRLSHARIEAKKQMRPEGFVKEGEVLTACQQACPTGAIIFGNTIDPVAQVAKLKAEPENHTLLEELNTMPRTSYLTRFKNPNAAMKA